MDYQVLARKWRPTKFQEVIGQSHITNSLQNAITHGKLGHAYILTGTRGIGKTSVARLLAKSLRCQNRLDDGNPCGQCEGCQEFDSGTSMNVLEIDGASNNSVDDVRDIINNVHYLPTSGKYKIYIIDEVHMLSTSAFNALLKTLEEPPEHVIFIFATTEPNKLLGTVLSRCQRFDFRNASQADLEGHIKKIAESESIEFENGKIISQIAKLGSGSVRDTLSLLDQVLSFAPDRKVTEDVLVSSLGLAKTSSISSIVCSLLEGDVAATSNHYRKLNNENVQLKNIVTSLLDFLFEAIERIDDTEYLEKEMGIGRNIIDNISCPELMWIYEQIGKESGWILESIDPIRLFEINLQKLAMRRELIQFEYSGKLPQKKKTIIKQAVETENPVSQEEPVQEIKIPLETLDEESPPEEDNPEPLIEETSEEVREWPLAESWDQALSLIREEAHAMAAYLERTNLLSPIESDGEKTNVNIGVPEHEKIIFDYLENDETREKVRTLLAKAFKKEVSLEFQLLEKEETEKMQFKTKAEIIEEREQKELEDKESRLKNNSMLRKAEDIFNSKVDKVVLNKEIK